MDTLITLLSCFFRELLWGLYGYGTVYTDIYKLVVYFSPKKITILYGAYHTCQENAFALGYFELVGRRK
jgi:hypothetical protein